MVESEFAPIVRLNLEVVSPCEQSMCSRFGSTVVTILMASIAKPLINLCTKASGLTCTVVLRRAGGHRDE